MRLIGNRKHLYRSGQRLLDSCWGKLCTSSETARTAASSYPLMLSSGEGGKPCPINLVGMNSANTSCPPSSFLTAFDGSVQGLAVCSSTSVDEEQVAQQIPRAHQYPALHSNELCCLSRRDSSMNTATHPSPRVRRVVQADSNGVCMHHRV